MSPSTSLPDSLYCLRTLLSLLGKYLPLNPGGPLLGLDPLNFGSFRLNEESDCKRGEFVRRREETSITELDFGRSVEKRSVLRDEPRLFPDLPLSLRAARPSPRVSPDFFPPPTPIEKDIWRGVSRITLVVELPGTALDSEDPPSRPLLEPSIGSGLEGVMSLDLSDASGPISIDLWRVIASELGLTCIIGSNKLDELLPRGEISILLRLRVEDELWVVVISGRNKKS